MPMCPRCLIMMDRGSVRVAGEWQGAARCPSCGMIRPWRATKPFERMSRERPSAAASQG
jgi:hypothetical protein